MHNSCKSKAKSLKAYQITIFKDFPAMIFKTTNTNQHACIATIPQGDLTWTFEFNYILVFDSKSVELGKMLGTERAWLNC